MCINSIFTISSLRLILSIPILTMWKQSNKEAKNLAQRFTEPRLVGVQIPRESREKHKVPLVAAIFTRTMASKNFWKPVSSCLAFHRIFAFAFFFKEVSHSLNSITLLLKAVDGMRISSLYTQENSSPGYSTSSMMLFEIAWYMKRIGGNQLKTKQTKTKNRTSKSKHSCNSRNLWNRTDVEQPATLLTHGVRQRSYRSSWAWRLHKPP